MFATRVKNGIMGTFRFDKNGDIVPNKWISFDKLQGQHRRVRVRRGHQGRRVAGDDLRSSDVGKGLERPFPHVDEEAKWLPTFRRRPSRSDGGFELPPSSSPRSGCILVALVLVWLGINLAKDWDQFFRIFLIGLTNGALYALVALGYTLVYGILELINFAHGDVFMIGGMVAATVALSMFSLQEDPALGTLVPAILVALLFAMAGCALLNAIDRARRVQAASAGAASRAADHGDRGLVHPPERRPDLEGLRAGRDAAVAPGRGDLHGRHLPGLRRLHAGIASSRS